MQTIFFQPPQHKSLNTPQRRFGSNTPNRPMASQSSENRLQGDSLHLTSLQRRRDEMGRYLEAGFDLIRKERFAEAIRYFQDTQQLKSMNIGVNPANRTAGNYSDLFSLASTVGEANKRIDDAADQNEFFKDSNTICFANVLTPEVLPEVDEGDSGKAAILKHLKHENALMAAEENIHAYQHLLGRNLTYAPAPGMEAPHLDDEIDIAATFARHGVPVTKAFMGRYKGIREAHVSHPKVWDLVETDGQITRTVSSFTTQADKRKGMLPTRTTPADKRKGVIQPDYAGIFT